MSFKKDPYLNAVEQEIITKILGLRLKTHSYLMNDDENEQSFKKQKYIKMCCKRLHNK